MADSKATTRKVLLVEGEEEAKFIRGLFEKDDSLWDICWVPTLKEAAEWLKQNKGDLAPLVIADYSLPDGLGLNLAEGVKTPDEMDFPLVILLGDGTEEEAIEALKSGALDCVVKGEKEIRDLPRVAKDVLREWDYITERREAKELFTALADNSQIGIYITQEGKIKFANLFLQRHSGFSEEELLNMDSLMLVHPEDRKKVRENAIKMLKGERSTPYEFRVVTKDGEIRWVLESVTSIHYQGKRAVLGNFMDITERKEIERRLKESEEKYRLFFHTSRECICIVTKEGKWLDANEATVELFGFESKEELFKVNIKELYQDPKDRERFIQLIEEQGFVRDFEVNFRRKDGSIINALLTSTAKKDEKGNTLYYQGVIKDITERKKLEAKLKETVEKLRKSREELSTPVVQIWDKILALPLIGIIDSLRAQDIMEVLLNRIVETGSEIVIIDITGVSSVDTEVANHLIKTIQAAMLLGTECVLTGIKPEIAQTMIQLGLNMGEVPTRRNMQEGLLYGFKKLGYEVRGVE